MKRLAVLILAGILTAAAWGQDTSFSAGLGFESFNYEGGNGFLTISVQLLRSLGDDILLDLGGCFGLTTRPRFLVPLHGGLQFRFPFSEGFELFSGFGLTPVFLIENDKDEASRFYLGPYLTGGLRVRVHRYLQLFLQGQQSLLIGAPAWINTSSRILMGTHFVIP